MSRRFQWASFRTRLLIQILLAFLMTALGVVLVAQVQFRQVVHQVNRSLYGQQLRLLLSDLTFRDQQRRDTGLHRASSDDITQSALDNLAKVGNVDEDFGARICVFGQDGRLLQGDLPQGHEIPIFQAQKSGALGSDGFREAALWIGSPEASVLLFGDFGPWEWTLGFVVPLRIWDQALRDLRMKLLMVVVFITIAVVCFLYLGLRRQVEPLEALTQAARSFVHGQEDFPVFSGDSQETRELVEAFTIMRGNVRRALTEFHDLNQELESRVQRRTAELEHSLNELKKAQDQLVETKSMASLGQLVAGVSHEIGTPLSIALMGTTQIIDELNACLEHEDDEFCRTLRDSAATISTNLKRVGVLVRSFKQIAVDQSTQDCRTVALVEYLETGVSSLKPGLKRTGHTIHVQGNRSVIINTNPGALMQVVTNLFSNCLIHAFGHDGQGSMILDVQADAQGRAVITFSDNGRGMTESVRQKIFEPFYTTKRGRGGTGLGLSISYNVVRAKLAGTIICQSAPGEGCTFIITLPDLSGSPVSTTSLSEHSEYPTRM